MGPAASLPSGTAVSSNQDYVSTNYHYWIVPLLMSAGRLFRELRECYVKCSLITHLVVEKLRTLVWLVHTSLMTRCLWGEYTRTEVHTSLMTRCFWGEYTRTEVHTTFMMGCLWGEYTDEVWGLHQFLGRCRNYSNNWSPPCQGHCFSFIVHFLCNTQNTTSRFVNSV